MAARAYNNLSVSCIVIRGNKTEMIAALHTGQGIGRTILPAKDDIIFHFVTLPVTFAEEKNLPDVSVGLKGINMGNACYNFTLAKP
jgi:hypothetical protein